LIAEELELQQLDSIKRKEQAERERKKKAEKKVRSGPSQGQTQGQTQSHEDQLTAGM
jgi:hypothetical protein